MDRTFIQGLSADAGLVRRLTCAAVTIGIFVALVGAGHLAAWCSGYMADKGFSTLTMKTNTALLLLLLGLGLVLLVPVRAGLVARRVAGGMACLAAIVGLLSFCENWFRWDLGIDQLLIHEAPGALGVVAPNRMGTPASVCFLLAGSALLILSRGSGRGIRAAQWLALAVCLIALLGTIGFLYDVQGLHTIVRVTGIAWPTAVSLLAMGIGILCARPAEGLMLLVTSDDIGGVSLRRLLPVSLLPILFGWLQLAGERMGVFDPAMGTAIMMIIFIVALIVLGYVASLRVGRSATALHQQQERLRFALETIHIGEWAVDLTSRHIFLSPEHDRIFGYARPLAEWTYDMFLEHVLPEDRAAVDGKLRHAIEIHGDWNFECRIRRKDGQIRWILAAGRHSPCAAGIPCLMVGIIQDITDRKRTEEELGELTQRLTYHVDNSPLAVIEWGPDMRLVRWSGEAERIFGWKAHEVLGKRMEDLRWIYSEDQSQVAQVSEELRTGTNPRRFSSNRNYRKDGSVAHCEWYNSSLLDESGKLRSILSLVLDVTDRKRTEEQLRHTAENLRQSNQDLEQFAYVASHDLQEPLRMISGFLKLLEERYAPHLDDKAREFIGYAVDGAKRMSQLINDLLTYSRVGYRDAILKSVDANGPLNAALNNLTASITEARAKITHDDLPTVKGDTGRLTQLFQNLISNAIKFRRDGVAPEVHIGCRRDGDYWLFTVRDNGIGIAQENIERVFLIFQRLHSREQYAGTGIGLAICKKIVEQHGGKIWIESKVGQGSVFCFNMPEANA